ncbi:MAG TPA: tetratricopeptide repeat protein [Isosphaeraceae bacterium]|nr:tetratricopeptide repeat protein [Isosphaeraceae bacterium]
MASVDPYSPCPCGSGQKFKWCCQKMEAVAGRAHRLYENGQIDAAIEALDAGLRKDPGNAWLLTRKAIYLLGQDKVEPAKAALRLVLDKQPRHVGALLLMTRLTLETEGPAAGAAQLQQALSALPSGERKKLAGLARVVGVFLSESAQFPAALKHLALAQDLAGEPDPTAQSAIRMIQQSPTVSPWMKNLDPLVPAPEGLAAEARERFEQAVRWGNEGFWASAASAFDTLAADQVAAAEAECNLGLCRLWMADNAGAVDALRRSVARLGANPEAVDLEALCQQVAPPGPDDLVERVQLIWPLRDREGLLKALRDERTVEDEGPASIDPDDPNSPEVEHFALLDRPLLQAERGLRPDQIPRVVGRVLVGQEIVALEAYDDGRLNGLIERVTTLAGSTIPAAHPRTKGLDKITRTALALSWDWLLPAGMEDGEVKRLTVDQGAWLIREVWPNTPQPFLGGRTPLQAAQAGDAVVPLRAAIFQLEQSRESWRDAVDFDALRAALNIGPEPPIDPEAVDIARLHLARLVLIPVDRLSDEKLVELYRRARANMLSDVLERAARSLVARPGLWDRAGIEPIVLHTDLALLAAGHDRLTEAFDWTRRGRQADPAPARAKNAPMWDMLEIRLKSRSTPPEVWVPDLAVIMDRYRDDQAANQAILLNLLEMGLVQMVPNPDKPDDILIDSRMLQTLMAEYGPRVTTASGQLGVSATRGGLWTPGSSTGGGGAIWTPGADAPGTPGGDKPKLIIPGR